MTSPVSHAHLVTSPRRRELREELTLAVRCKGEHSRDVSARDAAVTRAASILVAEEPDDVQRRMNLLVNAWVPVMQVPRASAETDVLWFISHAGRPRDADDPLSVLRAVTRAAFREPGLDVWAQLQLSG